MGDVHVSDVLLGAAFTMLWWFIRNAFTKFDERHNDHYRHAEKKAIHQESMDVKLIESKFELVHQKINSLEEKLSMKLDNIVQLIASKS